MKIELVVSSIATTPSLASRVAPAPSAAGANGAAPRGGARPRRGRGGGRRKANERPAKTAADLDAEMEDYTTSNTPAAAPATATAA
ncbi:hypothetical protein BXZ70DRAFT_1006208 [Cristinia sonorae]|uniref:Chromatin target of PRMT1 protein C-terminal domain-containing protein n=1 Tax=Cristinia sonorae TaxID=1940300 RepID=A0A8K0UUR0_9AGAR|nr:hypothetical protein BXZ70DRAFT_1006208 [Cristinia sonorae]